MSIFNQGGPSATSLNFLGFEDAAKNNTGLLTDFEVSVSKVTRLLLKLILGKNFMKCIKD